MKKRMRYMIDFCRPDDSSFYPFGRTFACYATSTEDAIQRLKQEWPDAIVKQVDIWRIKTIYEQS